MSYVAQMDETMLEVGLDCGRKGEVTIVVEDGETVVIRARLQRAPGDCGLAIPIYLTEPLAGRSVVDGYDDRAVEVMNRQQPEDP